MIESLPGSKASKEQVWRQELNKSPRLVPFTASDNSNKVIRALFIKYCKRLAKKSIQHSCWDQNSTAHYDTPSWMKVSDTATPRKKLNFTSN